MTTHSTIFTGCDDKNSTYLFTKPNGSTNVIRVEKSEGLKSAKDVLGHKNIDLFGDECVVFIEGASEEAAFPIIAQSFGCDVWAKGINFVNVKGKDKFKKLEEYLGYLQGSGVICYVIADGSDELRRNLVDWQRAGIIKADNWTMWDLEFEDCFNSDLIAQAVNEMMEARKVKLGLSAAKLDAFRGHGVSIVKCLNEIFKEKNVDLNKPELAERLAILLNKESVKEGYQKNLIEKTIEKIIKLVDEKYDAKTENI